jgi:tetratricopeptide (TPR) repeat protein
MVDTDGSEIDWHVGYGPPPEKYLEKIENSLKGTDTFKSLSERYAKDPKNIEVVFKLAQKVDDRYSPYDPQNREKILKLYNEVLALDPEGKLGTTDYEDKKVTFTEYAEFSIGVLAYRSDKRDPEPLKAYLKKYPQSPMLRDAYLYLALYYMNFSSKEEATKFFEDYVSKYPDEPYALSYYVSRIIRDKDNLDRGIELAKKINEIMKYNTAPRYTKNLAELYVLKGEPEKADEAYGKDYMEGKLTSLSYDLIDYAYFWVNQNKNTESAVAMVEKAVRLSPDNSYILQQAAGIYCKQNKPEKALEIYGPEFIKKHMDESSNLGRYVRFWTNQGKNLESALEVAKKAVALSPTAFTWDALSAVHVKLKNYAEALKAAEKALELSEEQYKDRFKKRIEDIKKAMAEGKK